MFALHIWPAAWACINIRSSTDKQIGCGNHYGDEKHDEP